MTTKMVTKFSKVWGSARVQELRYQGTSMVIFTENNSGSPGRQLEKRGIYLSHFVLLMLLIVVVVVVFIVFFEREMENTAKQTNKNNIASILIIFTCYRQKFWNQKDLRYFLGISVK